VIWSDGLPAANRLTDSLKAVCSATHLKCLGPASAAVDEATLATFWKPTQIAAWLHTYPHSRRCLAALLSFANDHVPSAMKRLDEPEHWIPDGEVRLGNAALEQLGLLSLTKEKDGLLGLIDRCRSVAGRRLMRSRLLRPITEIAELEARLDRIEKVDLGQGQGKERGLRSLYDMSRLWRRLELGSASMNDMACLLRSYEAAAALGASSDLFVWIFARWDTAATVAAAREDGIPLRVLPFVAGTYPEADALFAKGLVIRAEAEALCQRWSQKQGKEQLYLDDAEGGGFRITGTKRRIAAAYTSLRDSGDSSAEITAYKTTSALENATLQELSARHRKWFHQWVSVWADTWAAAREAILVFREQSAQVEAWCADLDVTWTIAQIAKEWHWTRPIFVEADEGMVDVEGLRHPILERLVKVPYVSHTVMLTEAKGLLLYGMNASGKSSLMKALGLCTIMAQAGFPVPATAFRLAPFTAIFTRILGNDNLWAGLSSFAVEMTEFREILQFADERSLVLGDELCSGTESLSATALVAAGVETLAARGSKFVFATHLHELAALLPESVKAMHLKVHYDAAADLLIYDRTLAPGSGSALYGLEVCRALDLPKDYLDRAIVLRKQLAGWIAPHRSAYSADAVMERCAVCDGTTSLEAHHIVPQASVATTNLDVPGNLVCLCATCHDDHHGGRLTIHGWIETSAGRRLSWTRSPVAIDDEVRAWIREQRQLKVRIPTIQRMARQIFGVELTPAQIKQ
jgi:DNA mismatch repair protein MutS